MSKYHEWKAAGLCVRCGKRESMSGLTMCQECRDKRSKQLRDNRKYYESVGICTNCHKNKAEPDGNWCLECRGKAQDEYAEHGCPKGKRERDWKNKKAKMKERLANGICPVCGKEPAYLGGSGKRCRAKMNIQNRKRRGGIPRSERISFGLCYNCGKPLDINKGLCSECYHKRIKALPDEWYQNNNSYWKKLESLRIEEVKRKNGYKKNS